MPEQNTKESAYKKAGVDIEAAANLVERIKPLVKKTNRPGVMSGLGGFGAFFDPKETGYEDPVFVSSTDGVGTKIKIAIDIDRHDTIGIDAVAMCVNDIVVQGAEPLFFLDYFATGKLVNDVAEKVIAGIAEGCSQAGCALIGGETAEMPGLYAPGDYDIAGFCVGAVERNRMITGENICEGDVVLGLSSNGLHSNGFSLVRNILQTTQGHSYESRLPFESALTLGEFLLIPTRIYVRSLLKALQENDDDGRPCIKGMAHITGGGLYENIPRILPEGLGATIDANSWPLPKIYQWLFEIGRIDPHDMAQTMNCGIGFVVVCAQEDAARLKTVLAEEGETVYEMGTIAQAQNAENPVTIDNIESAWS